ncbi:MAG: Zinc metalloprotease [Burkholderia sp.]|jgi:regulator of sigma E protease
MTLIFALLGFTIVLGTLVVIHEGGHCFTAKLLGIRVERFSLGFGPVLWRRVIRGTEYCVSALPLGGYVKMLNESDEGIRPEDLPYSYERAPRWKRALVLFMGPAVNFIFAFVLYAAVGLIGVPDIAPILGTPPAQTQAAAEGVRAGDRILSVEGAAIRGLTDLNLELIARAGEEDVKAEFSRGGETYVRHFSLAGESLDDVSKKPPMLTLGLVPEFTGVSIVNVMPGSPAKAAGIEPGSLLLAVDGRKAATPADAVKLLKAAKGGEVTLLVKSAADPEAGAREVRAALKDGKLGVALAPGFHMIKVRLGPVESVTTALNRVRAMTALQAKGIGQMATGEASTKNLSGPVAIAQAAGSAVQSGLVPFLEFTALISLALGFMNLLPIPVLDGGQLCVLACEGALRRDFSEKTRENIGKVGLILLLAVFALAMTNDFSRLLGG